ncbi:MAG TPA: hypothetical protein VEE82_02905 [Thermodesulfovibrionales bacterium]|nr:hypothetical protein [Thermodesulfovibrionales bacterium]
MQPERFIREAIYSIQDQSFSDFELNAINGGSTDNSGSIVKSIRDTCIEKFQSTIDLRKELQSLGHKLVETDRKLHESDEERARRLLNLQEAQRSIEATHLLLTETEQRLSESDEEKESQLLERLSSFVAEFTSGGRRVDADE